MEELSRAKEIERSIIKRYRKELWSRFVKAVKAYSLIGEGDRIAVCMSGGKDSFLMAKLLQELQRHGQKDFSLRFLVMDPGYLPANRALILENAALLEIPVEIFSSPIFEVVEQAGGSPATSARACGGGISTNMPRAWAATRSPSGTTSTTR